LNLRFIDWIWHVRGSLALAPGQSSAEAFNKLEPLFAAAGTSHRRTPAELNFVKKNQAAQDKMSVFDGGALRIDQGATGPVLRYHLTSRALLFCFLAPLLFLALAQLTLVVTRLDKTPHKAEPPPKVMPMNRLDKLLGAPAPEPPKKDEGADPEGGGKKPTPTAAYIFAGIFTVLYIVGRILEARLVKTLFRKRLLEA
jgi:hypothetical protein